MKVTEQVLIALRSPIMITLMGLAPLAAMNLMAATLGETWILSLVTVALITDLGKLAKRSRSG